MESLGGNQSEPWGQACTIQGRTNKGMATVLGSKPQNRVAGFPAPGSGKPLVQGSAFSLTLFSPDSATSALVAPPHPHPHLFSDSGSSLLHPQVWGTPGCCPWPSPVPSGSHPDGGLKSGQFKGPDQPSPPLPTLGPHSLCLRDSPLGFLIDVPRST